MECLLCFISPCYLGEIDHFRYKIPCKNVCPKCYVSTKSKLHETFLLLLTKFSGTEQKFALFFKTVIVIPEQEYDIFYSPGKLLL